jgi:drug/metabolite transporter (DMT)-like permease
MCAERDCPRPDMREVVQLVGLTASRLIGHLLAGMIIGIVMSYLARRKGWNQWGWLIGGWAAGAFLGFVVGGLGIGIAFYLVRAYHMGKTPKQREQ